MCNEILCNIKINYAAQLKAKRSVIWTRNQQNDKQKFVVLNLTERLFLNHIWIELQFRSVSFCRGRKIREPREKPSEQGEN